MSFFGLTQSSPTQLETGETNPSFQLTFDGPVLPLLKYSKKPSKGTFANGGTIYHTYQDTLGPLGQYLSVMMQVTHAEGSSLPFSINEDTADQPIDSRNIEDLMNVFDEYTDTKTLLRLHSVSKTGNLKFEISDTLLGLNDTNQVTFLWNVFGKRLGIEPGASTSFNYVLFDKNGSRVLRADKELYYDLPVDAFMFFPDLLVKVRNSGFDPTKVDETCTDRDIIARAITGFNVFLEEQPTAEPLL